MDYFPRDYFEHSLIVKTADTVEEDKHDLICQRENGFYVEGALTVLGKNTIVAHRVVRMCESVCLCVCPHTFWSAATCKVNGTANRSTRL